MIRSSTAGSRTRASPVLLHEQTGEHVDVAEALEEPVEGLLQGGPDLIWNGHAHLHRDSYRTTSSPSAIVAIAMAMLIFGVRICVLGTERMFDSHISNIAGAESHCHTLFLNSLAVQGLVQGPGRRPGPFQEVATRGSGRRLRPSPTGIDGNDGTEQMERD